MKNLFIMHTQYNLILAAAVAMRNSGDESILLLYPEFKVTDEIRQSLANLFSKVVILNENYTSEKTLLKKVALIRKCLKKTKSIWNEVFDRIYMSQERVFDLIVCTHAKKNNPHIRSYHIEEDAYYSLNNSYNADGFVQRVSYKDKMTNLARRILLLEYAYNYKDVSYCYGMSKEYDAANLLYPKLARRELQGKELIEITKGELTVGIDALYANRSVSYPDSAKYMVIFFDLMNRYKSKETVLHILRRIIIRAQAEGRTVLAKYHPRETEKFQDLDGIFELEHLIPAEKVLLDLAGKDVVVIGNATTSCLVAAKLEFRVVSISKLAFPENSTMHTAMEKMGIICIKEDIERTI